MNINTLKDLLTTAIASNTAIGTWCSAKYAASLTVYCGVDTRNPPGSDEYPICHIHPIGKTARYAEGQISHRFMVVCGVHDETLDTVPNYSNLHATIGMDYVEELRALVQAAIAAVIPSGSWIDRIDIEYDNIDFYPYHLAGMEITINTPLYQGDDPLI